MANRPVVAVALTEVVAVKKDVAEGALRKLLDQIKAEKGIHIRKEKLDEAVKLESPPKDVPEAYSQIMETELEFESFKRVFEYVMKYGPSALEIIEPKEMNVSLNEAQDLVNKLATFMHRFAAAGVGGIVATPK